MFKFLLYLSIILLAIFTINNFQIINNIGNHNSINRNLLSRVRAMSTAALHGLLGPAVKNGELNKVIQQTDASVRNMKLIHKANEIRAKTHENIQQNIKNNAPRFVVTT